MYGNTTAPTEEQIEKAEAIYLEYKELFFSELKEKFSDNTDVEITPEAAQMIDDRIEAIAYIMVLEYGATDEAIKKGEDSIIQWAQRIRKEVWERGNIRFLTTSAAKSFENKDTTMNKSDKKVKHKVFASVLYDTFCPLYPFCK